MLLSSMAENNLSVTKDDKQFFTEEKQKQF